MFFFLDFRIWNAFRWLFTFQSVYHVYFVVVQLFLLPIIFTSRMLSNTVHWLEYFCYVVTQTTQILYPQHRKNNSETDPEQQKQLILTDSKNILTSHFQPIQRLQPNFIKWWHKKFHGITETMQTTHFNRWQEYFY